jgi:type IV conjugative transfer system protein TraE
LEAALEGLMRQMNFDEEQVKRQVIVIALTVFLGLSLVCNVILLLGRDDQTIALIPSTMSGEWNISRVSYDERYLADAALHLAELYLETTPETTGFRQENILRWVHPAHRQAVIERLLKEADNIRKQRLTSTFVISEIATQINGDHATSRVVGTLSRFVADRRESQIHVVVTIGWLRDRRGSARISNLDWRELENNETANNF